MSNHQQKLENIITYYIIWINTVLKNFDWTLQFLLSDINKSSATIYHVITCKYLHSFFIYRFYHLFVYMCTLLLLLTLAIHIYIVWVRAIILCLLGYVKKLRHKLTSCALRCDSKRISSIAYGNTLTTSIMTKVIILGVSHINPWAANVIPKPRNRNACRGDVTSATWFVWLSVTKASSRVSHIPLQAPQEAART